MSKRRRKTKKIIISWKLILRLLSLVSFLVAGFIFYIAVSEYHPIQVSNVRNIANAFGCGIILLLVAEFTDN